MTVVIKDCFHQYKTKLYMIYIMSHDIKYDFAMITQRVGQYLKHNIKYTL